MTYEEKKNVVIDNCFQQDCDINTTIKEAYTKGFNRGADKQRYVVEAKQKEIDSLKEYDKGRQQVIDRIRAEINKALSEENLSDNNWQISDVGIGLELALLIIDKYKAESENEE